MLIGAHVSIAGGIENAPQRAKKIGCEIFQVFSRSPQGGNASKLTDETVENFLSACKKYEQKQWIIHTPYYINLANPSERIRKNSIRIIRDELKRASLLKADYVITHLGSSREVGESAGIVFCIEGIKRILDEYRGNAKFLIEISAGSGNIIGDKFEELAKVLDSDNKIGVCFDTQHAFASGYDLRDSNSVKNTLDLFDKIIGLNKLKVAHCNDSKVEFSTNKDRHEHIGDGYIGIKGFQAWFNDARVCDINLYLETEHDKIEKDIAVLKKLRGN